MTRITFARLVVLMLAVAGLALQGCGGDDNGGLSATDMARITQAEADAAAAQAAADVAQAELTALQAQVDAAEPEVDTSDLDDAIAALQKQIEALTEKTADPMTPPEILGGAKSKLTVADVAALSKAIAKELNETEVVPPPAIPAVNKPALSPTDRVTKLMAGGREAPASQVSELGDHSSTTSVKEGSFLTHTFAGTATSVDLTSMADVETLKLGRLLKVDGVELFSFSVKETDKMMTAKTNGLGETKDANDAPLAATALTHTSTITLGADGSESVVTTNPDTGLKVFRRTTSFVDGSKIVEYNPIVAISNQGADDEQVSAAPAVAADGNFAAIITLPDGRVVTHTVDITGDVTSYEELDPPALPTGAALTRNANVADLAAAQRKYKAVTAPDYASPDHSASGYGGWLTDSFFAAYVIKAADAAAGSDEMVHKVVFGGRTMDSDMASNLSGRGETAMWKGLMVGHDLDADKGATYGDMLKGNATITARLGAETVAQAAGFQPDTARLVDVMLDNIINSTGEDARVTEFSWTNLNLADGSFGKGSEVTGQFYDNGNEVVGRFNKMDIFGAFGAVEYEMMDTMDDM